MRTPSRVTRAARRAIVAAKRLASKNGSGMAMASISEMAYSGHQWRKAYHR
jgi:hypothetical protein